MLRTLWEGWKELAHYIGDFQARLLLTVFYFTVAVPFAVITKLSGDILLLRPATGSAWVERPPANETLERALRQY